MATRLSFAGQAGAGSKTGYNLIALKITSINLWRFYVFVVIFVNYGLPFLFFQSSCIEDYFLHIGYWLPGFKKEQPEKWFSGISQFCCMLCHYIWRVSRILFGVQYFLRTNWLFIMWKTFILVNSTDILIILTNSHCWPYTSIVTSKPVTVTSKTEFN